jgi:RNA ligase (TIGR02306 family)
MSEEVENAEFSEANPLAEVISIQGVFNHPNADLLDLVSPDGSGVNFAVVKRGDFIAGQLAIWIDSVNDPMVPVDHPFFAHMAKAAKKDGYARVKTMRLRGIVSRGLLVPLPAEWVGKTNLEISSLLKMKKYFAPVFNYGCSIQAGQAIPGPQNFLPTGKYDVGSLNRGWKDIPDGAEVYITEKIHGANGCYGWLNYEGELKFWARSRTLFKKPPEGEYSGGLWWQVAAREGLEEKLKAKPGYVIYGELYGPVQELISYYDNLPFLRKGRVDYTANLGWTARYELRTDPGCWIIFHNSGNTTFLLVKDEVSRHLSFEKFFEELSIEGKENILFHLDLFRDRV